MSARGATVDGPCEPALVQLPDGRILAVFRVMAFAGHWGTISSDGGRSWGAPFPTGTWAVSPDLLALPSGAVVLSSGRPGIGLWVASFANHTESDSSPAWEFHNVAAAHNAGVCNPHPLQLLYLHGRR